MLLIGSKAFDMGRKPSDIDYIAMPYHIESFKRFYGDKIVVTQPSHFGTTVFMIGSDPIEFDTSETGQELLAMCHADWEAKRFELVRPEINQVSGALYLTASPALLLALKLTHRYLKNSPHFLKTMSDIHRLRGLGHEVPHILKDWSKARIAATYNYKHPVLDQSKTSFFKDDGVGYIYDHDTIHEAVKTFDVPAFNLIKLDAAEVYCSKEKFMAQSREVQLATVLEESLVLALERSQIPTNFEFDRYQSFVMALGKVCTSIASGWWRAFSWENYHEVLSMYDDTYVDRFKKALAEGIIKPYVAEAA